MNSLLVGSRHEEIHRQPLASIEQSQTDASLIQPSARLQDRLSKNHLSCSGVHGLPACAKLLATELQTLILHESKIGHNGRTIAASRIGMSFCAPPQLQGDDEDKD